MGSSQSSADKSETYTVDASGKITRASRNKPKPTENQADNKAETKQASGQERTSESSQSSELQQGTEQATSGGSQNQLSTLNNMATPSRGPSDQLRLKEMDEILNRMKSKYKPNSADMAGKNKSVFEEIERDLLYCYKVNKDQALKCTTLSEDYRRMVEKHRAQTLLGSVKS